MPRENEPNIYGSGEPEKPKQEIEGKEELGASEKEDEVSFGLPEEETGLFKEIQELRGLYSEKMRHRYTNLVESGPFEGKESLSEKAAVEVIKVLQEPEQDSRQVSQEEARVHINKLLSGDNSNPSQSIERIRQWIEEDISRLGEVSEQLIRYFKDEGELNLPLLSLCSEVYPLQDAVHLEWELALAIDASHRHFAPKFIDQMAILGRLNNKQANFKLHKILDFVSNFMITVQEPRFDEYDPRSGWVSGEMFMEFNRFAEQEKESAENYLVQGHLQNIADIIEMHDSKKKDAIEGIPGGSSDETIYKVRKILPSYQNRLKLRINQGDAFANPVLKVAPDYYGSYENGRLKEIYKENPEKEEELIGREQKYIAQNQQKYDEIYEDLNTGYFLGRTLDGIPRIEIIHSFQSSLKNNGDSFYFDTNRIDWQKLHPALAARILYHNQDYLDAIEGTENEAEPSPQDEFYKELFPLGGASEKDEYNYRYLMSLGMRKRIEDDFSIKMEDMSMWEQRNFLSFLERMPKNKVEKLQKFTNNFGQDGIKTFLSLEHGVEMVDVILEIGESEKGKERAQLIFQDYARTVDFAKDFNKAVTPVIEEMSTKSFDKHQVFNGMMYAGKSFLNFVQQRIKENPEIGYKEILQEIKKEHPGLDPKNCSEGIAGGAVIELVNQIGLEKTRDALNASYQQAESDSVKEQIDQALSFVTPSKGKPIHELSQFYEKAIQFEQYKYGTQEAEERLLQEQTKKDDKILDLGCGTGRLLFPLQNSGREKVTGVDFTGRHVKLIKEKSPDTKVLRGDWTHIGLKKESFNTVYSLGRSISHESLVERQNALFSEVNRVLEKGGKFIVDIPDRTRGHYKKLVDTHKEMMTKRGIEKFRKKGLIYDSPDEKNFATRYLYSEKDIENLARENGFKIKSKQTAELNNDYGDRNIYFVLEKISQPKEKVISMPKPRKEKIKPKKTATA